MIPPSLWKLVPPAARWVDLRAHRKLHWNISPHSFRATSTRKARQVNGNRKQKTCRFGAHSAEVLAICFVEVH